MATDTWCAARLVVQCLERVRRAGEAHAPHVRTISRSIATWRCYRVARLAVKRVDKMASPRRRGGAHASPRAGPRPMEGERLGGGRGAYGGAQCKRRRSRGMRRQSRWSMLADFSLPVQCAGTYAHWRNNPVALDPEATQVSPLQPAVDDPNTSARCIMAGMGATGNQYYICRSPRSKPRRGRRQRGHDRSSERECAVCGWAGRDMVGMPRRRPALAAWPWNTAGPWGSGI